MKTNYLNNKDILKEIHKSKNTYCSFIDSAYADYDMILDDVKKIDSDIIAEARINRAARLAKIAFSEAVKDDENDKRKLDEFEIPVESIKDTDVVFRVMTWEHIPLDDAKTKRARMVALEIEDDEDPLLIDYDEADTTHNKYVKSNFPPFMHYKVDESGELYCVGKSHWRGDLETGEFCKEHGQITRKLATMFIKLCEKYATRSNWRGYTYNDEMRGQALLQLSYNGLKFDESKSQNPFAYYTAAITNSFTRILHAEKRNQSIRDDILEANGMTPSFTRQYEWGLDKPGHIDD
jgi:hypothetical protein